MLKNYVQVETEVINGKTGNINYNIYFPLIIKPQTEACNTINNFSRHSCGEYIKYLSEVGNKVTEEINAVRCCQLMYSSRFLVSYKYEMTIFDSRYTVYNGIGGAVWNIRDGCAAKLGDFFRGNVRYREMILYIMSSKIKERIVLKEKIRVDWHERLYAAWADVGYYICKEGFVFLLPINTLKDEELRTFEVFIPFAELKNQLSGRLV